ncbi:MAG TPA: glycosyltransferase [Gaiellaceae bacterium]|nr:glycosyltransferase [Gaiellaceae bacterium]
MSTTTESAYDAWTRAYDTLREDELPRLRAFSRTLAYTPLVSLVLATHGSNPRRLRETIDSVLVQVYERWELCLAVSPSLAADERSLLTHAAAQDERIRLVTVETEAGYAAMMNAALEHAEGELVGSLREGDLLRPHALLLAVAAFNANGRVDLAYSDEDRIDDAGRRSSPWFKPDWNPALLLGVDYLTRFSLVRAEVVRQVGGFRAAYEAACEWDLSLRVAEAVSGDAIRHVPHVLYHTRHAESPSSQNLLSVWAAARATEDHLARVGRPGIAIPNEAGQAIRYFLPSPAPLVSVVVPTTAAPALLTTTLRNLLERTEYDRIEILLAVDERAADRPDRQDVLVHAAAEPAVRVLAYPSRAFNYAWTVNFAAAHAHGEFLLLLNDDLEVIHGDWLELMVGHGLEENVGAVGAALLYPDDTIQHAGVLLTEGAAGHLYAGHPHGTPGYIGRARLAQDISAVTAACMLVRRAAFDAVGGLDERFAVAYNDVDFCLRLRRAGWRVLLVPDAVLYHHESASFGSHVAGREDAYRAELELIRRRWREVLGCDPAHNPNLALDPRDPSRLAFPPRVTLPWRCSTGPSVSSRGPDALDLAHQRRAPPDAHESTPTFDPMCHAILFEQPLRLTAVGNWHPHIPLAFLIVDLLAPRRVVELGTHCGDSYCAFCQAVVALGLSCEATAVDTWEGDPHTGFYGPEVLDELSSYHDPRYGHFSRLLRSTFADAALLFRDGTIDLLHLDGYHTYEATREAFETWLPKLSDRGVLLLHDTCVRERDFGVWRLWEEVENRYPSALFADGPGLGVLAVGKSVPSEFLAFLGAARSDPSFRQLISALGEATALRGRLAVLEGEPRNIRDHRPARPRCSRDSSSSPRRGMRQ